MKIRIKYDIYHTCDVHDLSDKSEFTDLEHTFGQKLQPKFSKCDTCQDISKYAIYFQLKDYKENLGFEIQEYLEQLNTFFHSCKQQIRIKKLDIN